MPGSIFLQVANQPPASQQQGKIMAAEVDFSGPLCRKGSLVPCSLFSILYWLALDYCWNTAALHAFVSFYNKFQLCLVFYIGPLRSKLMKLRLYFANTRLVSGCTAWLFRYQKKECHSSCLVHFSFDLHVKLSLFYILKFLDFVKRIIWPTFQSWGNEPRSVLMSSLHAPVSVWQDHTVVLCRSEWQD